MTTTTDKGKSFLRDLVILSAGIILVAIGVYTQIDGIATGAGAALVGAGTRGLIVNE